MRLTIIYGLHIHINQMRREKTLKLSYDTSYLMFHESDDGGIDKIRPNKDLQHYRSLVVTLAKYSNAST